MERVIYAELAQKKPLAEMLQAGFKIWGERTKSEEQKVL